MFRMFFKRIFLLLIIAGCVAGCAAYYWATFKMVLTSPLIEVTVKPHSAVPSVAAQLRDGGLPIHPLFFNFLTRVMGVSTKLKSGSYEFLNGVSLYEVIEKIARGEVNHYGITVIEGWTFKQMRAEVDLHPALKHESIGMSDAELMHRIGADGLMAEGMFFPDTYLFTKGSTDLELYQRAYRLMQKRLNEAWASRVPGLPFNVPYEALIMASLVEKETGQLDERSKVAAVLINRLKKGMLLQTDSTVIYGMGKLYTGRIRKRDLIRDTPYNSYTRAGLLPTPIALPGHASLSAVLNPAKTDALYFVACGDGTSHFSLNLQEHNRAVEKYQRARQ
ncbi:endolytic transglycosylase MltG [Candidatus Pandoraea novymonadis]|uniref:Endolytic murein transglycosylase n=1 Tax=Candidatus Pandoraea novymonadis TaxID=1808959 RepID=A0ABX5FEI5_9BURK|nr:endolytic transglycosylase MltG [Candidatus Pandoraea novymonadis]PSB92123.1 hypothetical protein BZL35_00351 [Candidatus Pandoraea novymonadis]